MPGAFFKDLFARDDPMGAALVEVPFFQDLSRRELREVGQSLQKQTYASGKPVFEQGRPGMGMYVVLSGRVEICRNDEDGTRLQLGEVGPGEFFGELALLDDSARTASALAAEETELVAFTRANLLNFAEDRPHIGVKVLMHLSQIVAERLRRANRALKEARDDLEAAEDEPEAESDTQ